MTVQVIIEAVGRTELTAERVREVAGAHPAVLAHLEVTDTGRLIVGPAVALGHDPDASAPFRAGVFDPVSNRGSSCAGPWTGPRRRRCCPAPTGPTRATRS